MLLSQKGGRAEDCHLLAAHDGSKSGAKRNLGFAEPHIAANKAIHGFVGFHVIEHSFNRGMLVSGFLKRKTFGKSFVVSAREAEGVALAFFTHGIKVEKLCGRVSNFLGGFLFRLFPIVFT